LIFFFDLSVIANSVNLNKCKIPNPSNALKYQ